jgi:hypothetical protein
MKRNKLRANWPDYQTYNWDTHNLPEVVCYCTCGNVFQSHAKLFMVDGKFTDVSKNPCSKCDTIFLKYKIGGIALSQSKTH